MSILTDENLTAEAPSLQRQIEDYVLHLQGLESVFNQHAAEIQLGVRMDISSAVNAARDGTSLDAIESFFDRDDDSGVLHPEQLRTALSCIVNMIDQQGENGVILGAMQSGKTTTSLAMQFSGPIIYSLTGRRPYPLYLATSHTGQYDQTSIELSRFLAYYGRVKIVREPGAASPALDPKFQMSPTINYYRSGVLRNALEDVYFGPQPEDFVQRRVHGESIQRIAEVCRRADAQGFEPLLLIDEPQYGASDRMVVTEAGDQERRACVMLQIFQAIETALGRSDHHSFVGLSATPYDTHELASVWVVRQKLTSSYKGFNYFGGRTISEGVDVEPPDTFGFSELADEFDLPFFEKISLGAYDAQPGAFARFARKVGYTGTQQEYRSEVQATIKAAILHIASSAAAPVGVCLRLFNNNTRAEDFIRLLGIEESGIEVINYFGNDYKSVSVKRAIKDRLHPDRSFVIVVTSKARMGDAFPNQVRWFFDFSQRASDLNALLQGLLGRACGYNKRSTVILSDDNARIVEDYRRSLGGYIYPTSRHSIVVGGFRRGAPSNLVRLRADMDDPIVREFFSRIQNEVVEGVVLQNRSKLSTTRVRGGGFRTGTILKIADELGLFEHIEQPETASRLFPALSGIPRIARANDAVPHARDAGRLLRYTLDQNGNCRFTFRWSNGSDSHVGLSSRGYGARDATDRARAADNLEPQIHMEKVDPSTGDVIYDKDAAQQQFGNWRAYMVTLPLVEPVREIRAGLASMPNERSVHRSLMSAEEEALAGFQDEA